MLILHPCTCVFPYVQIIRGTQNRNPWQPKEELPAQKSEYGQVVCLGSRVCLVRMIFGGVELYVHGCKKLSMSVFCP